MNRGKNMKNIALNINVPDMTNLTEKDLKILLASKLYEIKELSLGQAAEIVGLSKRAFIEIIGQYEVSLFSLNADELRQDIANA